MKPRTPLNSNFAQLQQHDEQLLRVGMLAERYFTDDPNTSLLKLRQLAEGIAQITATYVGIYKSPQEGQYELLGGSAMKAYCRKRFTNCSMSYVARGMLLAMT